MAKKSNMNQWATYSIFSIVVILFSGLGGYVYYEGNKQASVIDESSLTATIPLVNEPEEVKKEEWETYFSDLKAMTIGQKQVRVSIAKSWPERIKGLSDTPYLPSDIVKLFVFDSVGFHSIWMKDMNYSIDIIWVDEANKIVHIVEGATPESYPAAFVPKVPAKYVIETVENFVKENQIVVGDDVVLPNL